MASVGRRGVRKGTTSSSVRENNGDNRVESNGFHIITDFGKGCKFKATRYIPELLSPLSNGIGIKSVHLIES